MKRCYLCDETQFELRQVGVRDNPEINVLECSNCGLVTLDTFKQISNEFYANSSMHSDNMITFEEWLRVTRQDDMRRFKLLKQKIAGKKVMDFGCGAGGFLELCEQTAASVAGIELEKRVLDYWSGKLNITTSPALNSSYDLITSFHVFEHLADPLADMRDLYNLLSPSGELVVEVPNANDALLKLYDCEEFKKFSYWGQHLYLYNSSNLSRMASKVGFKDIVVKHIQRYPLANHLHWLAKRQPGGHEKWVFVNDENLNLAYENYLASIGQTDTLILFATK